MSSFFSTRGGTQLGTHVLPVSPTGLGCRFKSVQDAISYAEDTFSPSERALILLSPGTYDEDVLIRKEGINIRGVGGEPVIKSVTVSDCTIASIDAFTAHGSDYTLLQRDVALGADYPKTTMIEGVRLAREVNNPVWGPGTPGGDDCCASFRVLGSQTDGSDFADDTIGLLRCFVEQAAGSKDGYGGVYGCMGCAIGAHQIIGGGGWMLKQMNQEFLFHCNLLANFDIFHDATTPGVKEPGDKANNGPFFVDGFAFAILLTGIDSRIGPPFGGPAFGIMSGPSTFQVVMVGPQNATPSVFRNMHIVGAVAVYTGAVTFENCHSENQFGPGSFVVGGGGSGAAVVWNGGRYMVAPTIDPGPPPSTFTENVGFGS